MKSPIDQYEEVEAMKSDVPYEVRLWDTQWMNIVNHDYSNMSKDDAVAYAIKMTEQGIAKNFADGKMPPAKGRTA